MVSTMGPPKPTFLKVFMANNLVLRWPKTFIFHGFGGSHGIPISIHFKTLVVHLCIPLRVGLMIGPFTFTLGAVKLSRLRACNLPVKG